MSDLMFAFQPTPPVPVPPVERWELLMNYTNFQGWDVTNWWPIYNSYDECRFYALFFTDLFQTFHGAVMHYALCNPV